MGLTVTDTTAAVFGGGSESGRNVANSLFKIKSLLVTFDTLYPTGGETLTLTNYGFNTIIAVIPDGFYAATGGNSRGYAIGYDYTAGKLKCFLGGGASAAFFEAPTSTDLSAVTTRITVIGY